MNLRTAPIVLAFLAIGAAVASAELGAVHEVCLKCNVPNTGACNDACGASRSETAEDACRAAGHDSCGAYCLVDMGLASADECAPQGTDLVRSEDDTTITTTDEEEDAYTSSNDDSSEYEEGEYEEGEYEEGEYENGEYEEGEYEEGEYEEGEYEEGEYEEGEYEEGEYEEDYSSRPSGEYEGDLREEYEGSQRRHGGGRGDEYEYESNCGEAACGKFTRWSDEHQVCVADLAMLVSGTNEGSFPLQIVDGKLRVNTAAPSASPTAAPTDAPTPSPTAAPSASPTRAPTDAPTSSPTAAPSASPTRTPTATPTSTPTSMPTAPTSAPTKACGSLRKSWQCNAEVGRCYWGKAGKKKKCLTGVPPTAAPTPSPPPVNCANFNKKQCKKKSKGQCMVVKKKCVSRM